MNLKGPYHCNRRCVYLFVSEIARPEMKSTTGNDNGAKQTMLYFKHVAIFRNKLTQIEVSVTFFTFCCFNITIS